MKNYIINLLSDYIVKILHEILHEMEKSPYNTIDKETIKKIQDNSEQIKNGFKIK